MTIEKHIEQINVQRRTPNLSANLLTSILEYLLKNSRSEQQIVAGVSPIGARISGRAPLMRRGPSDCIV